MTSYRAQLNKIDELHPDPVRYGDFYSRPDRLSVAMGSIDFPSAFPQVLPETKIRRSWTNKCNGVAFDGQHWLFSNNDSKQIYTFDAGTDFSGESIRHTLTLSTLPAPHHGTLDHVGHIIADQGWLYVDHFNNFADEMGAAVLILKNDAGKLSYHSWIDLEPMRNCHAPGAPQKRRNLVAINPWDSTLLTSFGERTTPGSGWEIRELFIHNMDGRWTGRSIQLEPAIADTLWVQGGIASSNGHIYISTGLPRNPYGLFGERYAGESQYIYCYSALHGRLLKRIDVTAEDWGQELEGLCLAPLAPNGKAAQLHVVLLDHSNARNDLIFIKSFCAAEPNLV